MSAALVRRANQLAPKSVMTQNLLVEALVRAGHFGEAAEVCAKFLEQNPQLKELGQFLKLAQDAQPVKK